MANFYLFTELQFADNNGAPLAGGLISTFAAGTVTPQATFTDSTGGSPNTNPVVCDSAGRCQMWLSPLSYKFVIKTSAGVTLQTIDGYNPDTVNTTVTSLTNTGNDTMQQITAATNLANQNSNLIKIQGQYWNGATTATDEWDIQDVLGTGTNPTSTLQFSHSGSSGASTVSFGGTLGVTGAISSSGESVVASGVFTNAQPNLNDSSKVGGINITTEQAALFGASQFTSEALTGGIQIPNTSTAAAFGSGVSGYANTSSTTTAAVGVFGGARAIANSTKAFGGNVIAEDIAGLTTGVTLSGLEVDTVPTNASTAYNSANGVSSIIGAGAHAGTFSDAFNASTNKSTAQWTNGFHSNSGAALQAVLADKLVASGATASQPIVFQGDSGGGAVSASISCDNAGNLVTTLPASGFFQASRIRLSEETTAFPSLHDSSSNNTGVNFRSGNVELIHAGVASLQAFGAGVVIDTEIRLAGGGVDVTSPDAGVARIAAGEVGISTSGVNSGGNLQVQKISKYGQVTTAGQGVPPVYGATSQKAESSADANVLTVTPPATVGTYRLSFVLDVSAATAAILGWTATWKDSNGNAVAPTNLSLEQSGIAAPALTFTLGAAGNLYGHWDINTDASATAIVIKLTLVSGTFTAKASATIERLI
jgi:hypothetical protein